jgi:hypothetical protein
MPNKILIQEELLRIMTEAERWQTIELAWNALLTVRRMDKELEREKIWHSGGIIVNNFPPNEDDIRKIMNNGRSVNINVNEDEIKKVIKSGVLDKTISNAMNREMKRRGIR